MNTQPLEQPQYVVIVTIEGELLVAATYNDERQAAFVAAQMIGQGTKACVALRAS
jgi:hypothetical protein